jgi:Kef-type K+ transport system membrane component KefB
LSEFVDFVLILASGLFFSELFKRLHLPYVVALIVAGIIIGPSVLDVVALTPTIEFMGSIGLVFLMFMAGKEVRTDILVKSRKKLLILALMNATIPAR